MDAEKIARLASEGKASGKTVRLRIDGDEWQDIDSIRCDSQSGTFIATRKRTEMIFPFERLAAVKLVEPVDPKEVKRRAIAPLGGYSR